MADNYWYSSLSGQEIEDTLLGAVRFNADQNLTTSQKAAARANIGAGESNSTFKILGYFPTLADLQEWLQVLPQAGDAYGIGTASPYDIYVYDGAHNTWVNNGPIVLSDALIDDEDISTDHTWSSTKINTDLSGKQNKITDSGILKGNGSGSVSAAVAGTDYLTPATNYSPVRNINAATYNISAADVGATLSPTYAMRNTPITVNLTQAVSTALPKGCEIAILNDYNSIVTLATNGVRIATSGNSASDDGYTTSGAHSFRIVEPFSMVALKKMNNDSGGDNWLITGNVEVVS